jgi:hypothetical protein
VSATSDLLFCAELSARYHRRRASFLDRTNLFLNLAVLVGASGAFISLFGAGTLIAQTLALVLLVIGVIQIVYRPEACAIAHQRWLAQWLELIREIKTTPKPSEENVAKWTERRYAIEGECVGELRALQADCYNRAARALEREGEPYRLRFWHRALIQVVSFEHAFEEG